MKINGENVARYNATQLTVTFSPPQDGAGYEWPDGMLTPISDPATQKSGTCTVELLIRGENRNEITRAASTLHGLCLPGLVELTLDGYKGTYKGYLESWTPEKTISPKAYKVKAVFDGWLQDTPVKLTYTRQTQATLHRVGSRPAPCVLTITPKADLDALTMTGWGAHEIVVKNLKRGHSVVIDGTSGLMTQDGQNKAQDVTLWALPAMDSQQRTIAWDSADCDVTVEYTPLWL